MAFRRSRLNELRLQGTGFEIETEIVVRSVLAGLRIDEVPSFESERRYGTSHLNTFRDGWRVLRTIVARRASWAATATSVDLPLHEPEFPAPTLAPRAPTLATEPIAAATSDDVDAIESLTA